MALNVERFLAFPRRLVEDARRKVFLIVDDLKVRHARKVAAWAASHAHAIAPFHLPAYAPEHDPDEHLDDEPKRKLRQQPQPEGKDELIGNIRSVLRASQQAMMESCARFIDLARIDVIPMSEYLVKPLRADT